MDRQLMIVIEVLDGAIGENGEVWFPTRMIGIAAYFVRILGIDPQVIEQELHGQIGLRLGLDFAGVQPVGPIEQF